MDFVSVNYLVLNLTTVNWQRDTVQNYTANKGMGPIFYGTAVDFVFKTLNVGVRLCVSPALVEMVGTNALCDLEKKNQRLPLFEGVAEGRFHC